MAREGLCKPENGVMSTGGLHLKVNMVKQKALTPNQLAFMAILRKVTKAELGRMAGVSRQAINKWDAIPGDYVVAIAAGTGLSEAQVRPEPYAKP